VNLVIDRMTEGVRVMCCHLRKVVLSEKIAKDRHSPLDNLDDDSPSNDRLESSSDISVMSRETPLAWHVTLKDCFGLAV